MMAQGGQGSLEGDPGPQTDSLCFSCEACPRLLFPLETHQFLVLDAEGGLGQGGRVSPWDFSTGAGLSPGPPPPLLPGSRPTCEGRAQ